MCEESEAGWPHPVHPCPIPENMGIPEGRSSSVSIDRFVQGNLSRYPAAWRRGLG